jgi:opacity protein-like surface antigen
MKTALIRILALATLATSISAFAAAADSKQNDAAATSASNQQQGCADYAHKEKKQKNAKPRRDDQRTDQEKELDRLLMGMYG